MEKREKDILQKFMLYLSIIVVYMLSFRGLELIYNQLADNDQLDFFKELIMMVLSGLLSATIAYFVSDLRVKKERERGEKKDNSQNLRIINLLNLEIRDNKEAIIMLNEVGYKDNSKEILETQLSFDIYKRYIDKVNLEDDNLMSLIKMYKKLQLFKIGSPGQMLDSYSEIINSMEKVIESLERDYGKRAD